VVIGTDWIGSCKFDYHTITTTTVLDDTGINDILFSFAASIKGRRFVISENMCIIPSFSRVLVQVEGTLERQSLHLS
jgi:hypothetical protein